MFGRSNEQKRNNGASPDLLVAHMPSVVSIVGFDLSGVTNEIESATFSFQMRNDMEAPVGITICPMAQTIGNAEWNEGSGHLGMQGQNACTGEATFRHRAHPAHPWESASGNGVLNLMDSALWQRPVAKLPDVRWKQDVWITVPVNDIAWLEAVRNAEQKTVTFGLWGTSGNGLYRIGSKESGNGPRLVLQLNDPGK